MHINRSSPVSPVPSQTITEPMQIESHDGNDADVDYDDASAPLQDEVRQYLSMLHASKPRVDDVKLGSITELRAGV